MLSNWIKNCLLWGPTVTAHTSQNSLWPDTCKLSPFGQTHFPAMQGYVMIISFIIILFLFCGPLYITWFIISAVIYAIYRMDLRWSMSDMSKKCCKIVLPFVANSYSSSTIVLKTFIVRVGTTLSHFRPCMVFRSVVHSVSCFVYGRDFFSETSTAFCPPINKILSFNSNNISTTTFALPINTTVSIFSTFKNSKTSKGLAGAVNKIMSGHNNLQAKVASILKKGRKAGCLSSCLVGSRALSVKNII